mgnify:CR=1 FL=1
MKKSLGKELQLTAVPATIHTYFGLLSPSGAAGSSGLVSAKGDGELGRSLSPE